MSSMIEKLIRINHPVGVILAMKSTEEKADTLFLRNNMIVSGGIIELRRLQSYIHFMYMLSVTPINKSQFDGHSFF